MSLTSLIVTLKSPGSCQNQNQTTYSAWCGIYERGKYKFDKFISIAHKVSLGVGFGNTNMMTKIVCYWTAANTVLSWHKQIKKIQWACAYKTAWAHRRAYYHHCSMKMSDNDYLINVLCVSYRRITAFATQDCAELHGSGSFFLNPKAWSWYQRYIFCLLQLSLE